MYSVYTSLKCNVEQIYALLDGLDLQPKNVVTRQGMLEN